MAQSASQAITGNNSFVYSVYIQDKVALRNLELGVHFVLAQLTIEDITVSYSQYLVFVSNYLSSKYFTLIGRNNIYRAQYDDEDNVWQCSQVV